MKAADILMWGSESISGLGFIYGEFTVDDIKPTDFRLPTYSDLLELCQNWDSITGYDNCPNTANTIKDSVFWDGSNSSDFTLLPGGTRGDDDGIFSGINNFATIEGNGCEILISETQAVFRLGGISGNFSAGYIRFVYSGTGTPPSTVTDYDGNIYDIIHIGSQYWLKQNYKTTRTKSGDAIFNATINQDWIDELAVPSSCRCVYDNDLKYL